MIFCGAHNEFQYYKKYICIILARSFVVLCPPYVFISSKYWTNLLGPCSKFTSHVGGFCGLGSSFTHAISVIWR